MRKIFRVICIVSCIVGMAACSTAYKVKPLPFKMPSTYPNVQTVSGVQVAAGAYTDPAKTKESFGFDILAAGMLPVEVVFDNQGPHTFELNGTQVFLEDQTGNIWPVLNTKIAYDRATKYAETNEIFKSSAYHGFLGAAAGSIIGAAIGIVTGENIGSAVGKGAAVGAAAGATIGGAGAYGSDEARRSITTDLREKSLQNQPVSPGAIAFGFLFFPGEAKTARSLRLQLLEKDTGKIHTLTLNF
ncbi:MAG: hypothetical protein PHP23_04775 [Desulfobacterales bacterium]|nr:hypothetical protein [Desulfobacterales bacterium]MDD4073776.1 hypothetical protein [Desulfobacterales bacterium]MDD4392063.1 hypothetical protein [Desulfobacterales bacterium]